MATGKQICRMGQKGLLPGPGEVNLVSGTREFTSDGQRWPTNYSSSAYCAHHEC